MAAGTVLNLLGETGDTMTGVVSTATVLLSAVSGITLPDAYSHLVITTRGGDLRVGNNTDPSTGAYHVVLGDGVIKVSRHTAEKLKLLRNAAADITIAVTVVY